MPAVAKTVLAAGTCTAIAGTIEDACGSFRHTFFDPFSLYFYHASTFILVPLLTPNYPPSCSLPKQRCLMTW